MPNISAAKPTKRKLLRNVAHSILLYGAPVWTDDMRTTRWTALLKVQRRILLRVASAYCTVSNDAIGVIAGIAPLDLLAKDRKSTHETPTDEDIMSIWQRSWDNSEKGRWTHTLILKIGPWINRKHEETDFHLTQILSGHGCFAEYLKRFGKLDSSDCWYCGNQVDDATHTIFACEAWHSRRSRVETLIGKILNPENIVNTMLESKENWAMVAELINGIMSSNG
jgi:hypothetical protein